MYVRPVIKVFQLWQTYDAPRDILKICIVSSNACATQMAILLHTLHIYSACFLFKVKSPPTCSNSCDSNRQVVGYVKAIAVKVRIFFNV